VPTYEYICRSCKHEFEVFQSMLDAAKRKCPACGKNSLERKIGIGAAVLFKGSGFYQTDYRTESYKKGAEADKKPETETKTESKAGTKAESKSEAKPDSKRAGSQPEAPPKKEPAKPAKGARSSKGGKDRE
jgi:putative FmdB family regulatory protein